MKFSDKRDDFNNKIVNYPIIDCYAQAASMYGVYFFLSILFPEHGSNTTIF